MRVPVVTAVQHRIHRWIDAWGIDSQLQSRRNAMVALTALTQRRAELIEVEALLASLDRAPAHEGAVPSASA